MNQQPTPADGPPLPNAAEVEAAARRLAGVAVRTPLLELPVLNNHVNGRVFLKAEMFQRTGSFKFRGAYNRLVQLSPEESARGVVAFSSGNHAQGVAEAARLLGIAATIVMPADAPAVKLANTRALGAEVVVYDRRLESREDLATRLAAERGAVLVPSFDDYHIIAGQGTAGLEIAEDLQRRGVTPGRVLICAGGGGLTAGCALALKARFPDTAIYTVEPADWDDHRRSFASGQREQVAGDAPVSICDALLSPSPGELTFRINRALCAGGLSVSDAEVMQAVAWAFTRLRLVLEPGGAVALAGLLMRKVDLDGGSVVVMCSGGNIDPAMLMRCLDAR